MITTTSCIIAPKVSNVGFPTFLLSYFVYTFLPDFWNYRGRCWEPSCFLI